MITAIIYTSNSGYTKQYAEMLSQKTGVPAYNTANSIPPQTRGKPVLYMGWIMAGNIQGYAKAAKLYDIRAVCQVGMAPPSQDQIQEAKKKLGIDVPIFYLQGGFDMNRLHGVYKLMMRLMSKKIIGDMEKLPERTQEQEELYKMATVGLSCVKDENLAPVTAWLESNS